jgi:hypothetical protein
VLNVLLTGRVRQRVFSIAVSQVTVTLPTLERPLSDCDVK